MAFMMTDGCYPKRSETKIIIYELLDQIVEREAGRKGETGKRRSTSSFPQGGKAGNKNVETFIKNKFDMQNEAAEEKKI